ncbi:MAG: hypothetical protein AAB430_03745 [Patescibacteria group bacterium]
MLVATELANHPVATELAIQVETQQALHQISIFLVKQTVNILSAPAQIRDWFLEKGIVLLQPLESEGSSFGPVSIFCIAGIISAGIAFLESSHFRNPNGKARKLFIASMFLVGGASALIAREIFSK